MFRFAAILFAVFAPTSFAQVANVVDQEFLDDIADGVSTKTSFALSIDVDLPPELEGQIEKYRFKYGVKSQTKCGRNITGDEYSTWRRTTKTMAIDLSGFSAGPIKLCLLGRVKNGAKQKKKDATKYVWRLKLSGSKPKIIEPVSPVSTPTPIVRWKEGFDNLSFDLAVSQNSDCSDPDQVYNGLTNTFQQLSSLSPGTYFACVTAHLSDGTTKPAKNNGYTWEQLPGVPGAFNIQSPSGTVTSGPVSLNWDSSADATSYDVSIHSSAACNDPTPIQAFNDVASTSQTLNALADGVYFSCVSAKNVTGNTDASNNGLQFELVTAAPGTFTIIAPSGTSITNMPTASWNPAATATSYDVVVSSDSNCSAGNEVQILNDVAGTSVGLGPLTDGSYFLCVNAKNAAGTTAAANNGLGWQQITSAPAAFNITAPANPSTNNMPTVSWEASAGASTYDLIVSQANDCSSPVQSFVDLNTTQQALAPLADGAYFACVTAKNIIGNTDATNNQYFWEQITQAPQPFSISGPTGFITTATPSIDWQAAATATSYNLVIASDSSCASIVQSHNGLVGTSFVATPALAEGSYFVCVDALNAAGSIPASNNGLSFTYDVTPPAAFNITAPPTTIATTEATVVWEAATDADAYDLEVSSNPDCSAPLSTFADLSGTSQMVTGLPTGTVYFCVTAKDEAGNTISAANDPYAVTVDIPTAPAQKIFVSSQSVFMDASFIFPPLFPGISSPEGADWSCSFLASQAGLITGWDGTTAVWKALISTSTTNAADRVLINSSVENMNGDTVANNAADLFDGNLDAPLNYDENGNQVTSDLDVWTGSDGFGIGTGVNCTDWFSPAANGTVGAANQIDASWMSSFTQACNQSARLYCVSPAE